MHTLLAAFGFEHACIVDGRARGIDLAVDPFAIVQHDHVSVPRAHDARPVLELLNLHQRALHQWPARMVALPIQRIHSAAMFEQHQQPAVDLRHRNVPTAAQAGRGKAGVCVCVCGGVSQSHAHRGPNPASVAYGCGGPAVAAVKVREAERCRMPLQATSGLGRVGGVAPAGRAGVVSVGGTTVGIAHDALVLRRH